MKTILVVDDEFGLAETLCDFLVLEGYQAINAWNGRLALEQVKERRPDLILCDVMMPIMDGRALLRTLKNDPESRAIPVLLMSSMATLTPEELALTAGFVQKPFRFEPLLALVRQLIG